MGARTIWHEVRCDRHGTRDKDHGQKVVKVNAPGTGIPKGCPIVGCPNSANSKKEDKNER